jgi:hypothetical protein
MGRNAFKIDTASVKFARQYIQRAMEDGRISKVSGYNIYRNADTPESLHSWCMDYLSAEQWDKLKVGVRKIRQLDKSRPAQDKNAVITLKKSGADILFDLAETTQLSKNDFILRYLDTLLMGGYIVDHNGKKMPLMPNKTKI